MAGRHPKTDEAIAMFINDEVTLWRMTAGAKRISVAGTVRGADTVTATFDSSISIDDCPDGDASA